MRPPGSRATLSRRARGTPEGERSHRRQRHVVGLELLEEQKRLCGEIRSCGSELACPAGLYASAPMECPLSGTSPFFPNDHLGAKPPSRMRKSGRVRTDGFGPSICRKRPFVVLVRTPRIVGDDDGGLSRLEESRSIRARAGVVKCCVRRSIRTATCRSSNPHSGSCATPSERNERDRAATQRSTLGLPSRIRTA
jgi:hypothetical protein